MMRDAGHLLQRAGRCSRDDLLLRALALVPGRQRHHHEAAVVRAALAGAGEGAVDLAGIAQRLDQLLDPRASAASYSRG